jgi:riboflavin kinase / FMN adenylyltransferase
VHGDKRGRTWGFPTANFVIGRKSFPLSGVYVVSVADNDTILYGVANVGVRPTVGVPKLLVEANLFNFSGDLYSRMLNVTFLERIRDEMKFDGFDSLKAQIMRDVEFGKNWLQAEQGSA